MKRKIDKELNKRKYFDMSTAAFVLGLYSSVFCLSNKSRKLIILKVFVTCDRRHILHHAFTTHLQTMQAC